MLRKLSLVAVAAASLGLAALAPTSASAWGGHGWHGGWHGGGWGWAGPRFYVGGPAYYGYGYGRCYVRQMVPTPWGAALAPGKPLLLTSVVQSGRQKRPWPAAAGALCPILADGTAPRSFHFHWIRGLICRRRETIFVAATYFCIITLK
jgi:hypothetical protein